ncbi:MAG TPA: NAD(P)-dependent oxidoreductase [Defluviitoga tunisiensis]|nr:NAD(P)-dependent oxidoreductase [Defluviitoga tunisiensis]
MKVLVTGVAGYIGSVLTNKLLDKGFEVIGIDNLLYGGESLLSIYNHPNFKFYKKDIRNIETIVSLLNEIDAVIHLAAIVGDPACAKQPQLAISTNLDGSINLLKAANNSYSVKNFIFASTCSNYGKMEGNSYVTEESPLKPVSLYAELKVKFEEIMLDGEYHKNFCPTALRFATAYGISPRMRFDLTVNEFTKDAALGRELTIFGEQFWRPYCNVEDIANACILVLESEPDKVYKNVFNVGDTRENYQKKMLAEELKKLIPDLKIKYVKKDEDPRDYKVSFEKIKNVLGFQITKTVPQGMEEIIRVIKDNIISDPDNSRYSNI